MNLSPIAAGWANVDMQAAAIGELVRRVSAALALRIWISDSMATPNTRSDG